MAELTFTKDRGRQEPIVANVLLDAAENAIVQAGGVAADATEIIDLPVGAIILEASIRIEETGTGLGTAGSTAVAMSAFTGDLSVGGTSLLAAAFSLRGAAGVGVKTVASLPAALTVKTPVVFTPAVGVDAGLDTATGKFRVTVKYAIDGRADEVQP